MKNLLNNPVLEKMYEELRNLALNAEEKDFNTLLGIVGDYLEDLGDEQACLCRLYWYLEGSNYNIDFGFDEGVLNKELRYDLYWSTNQEILFIPERRLSPLREKGTYLGWWPNKEEPWEGEICHFREWFNPAFLGGQ